MTMHEQGSRFDREVIYGPERPFEGKTALITGTTRGIGKAAAIEFGRMGANIIGNRVSDTVRGASRDRQVIESVNDFGVNMDTVLADITTVEGREALVAQVKEAGGIDFLVLNAAGGLEQDKPADYAETINIEAQHELLTALLPYIHPGGTVVYTTSKWARAYGSVEQPPGYPPVARTKYESEIQFQERILELAEHGIRLVVVSADLTKDTAAYSMLRLTARDYVERLRFHMDRDFPEPEEVAEGISIAVANRSLPSGAVVEVGSMFMFPPSQEKMYQEVNWGRDDVERILDMYGPPVIFVDDFQSGETKNTGIATYTPESANNNPSLDEFSSLVVSEDGTRVTATIRTNERHVAEHFKPEKNLSIMPGHRFLKIALDTAAQLGSSYNGVPVAREVTDIEFLQGVFADEELTVESALIDKGPNGFSAECTISVHGVPVARFGGLHYGIEESIDPNQMAVNERLESAAQALGLVYAVSADASKTPLFRRVKRMQVVGPIPVGSRVDKALIITDQNDTRFSGDVIDRIDGKPVTVVEGATVDLGPAFPVVARVMRAARSRRSPKE